MDNISNLSKELMDLRSAVEEQKKDIEQKQKTIETLDRELVKCKTEYELLEKRNKEIKAELDNILKIVDDVKALIESKDQYINSLEESRKRLTYLNIGFMMGILVLIAIVIILTLKS